MGIPAKCVHIHVHVYLGIRMFIENDWKDTHSTLNTFSFVGNDEFGEQLYLLPNYTFFLPQGKNEEKHSEGIHEIIPLTNNNYPPK